MKLCILGFDGLDSTSFEMTQLPNMSWLKENGQWGTLYSSAQVTGPCWTTILTGLKIKNHGITHLLGYPIDGSEWFLSRPKDYIFDFLFDHEYSVGVANFPSLLYAREIGNDDNTTGHNLISWMMAGWPVQPVMFSPQHQLPHDLYSDLPDYERRVLDKDNRKPKNALEDWAIHEIPWGEYIEWANVNACKRMSVIANLPQIDVLMIQESVIDRCLHMLSTPNKGRQGTEDPRYQEALELVDSLIGYVRDRYNPDYLSIVSDHGFQGISEANPEKGCWHSHRGTWAICGPGIVPVRNNFNQVHYGHTILDSIGLEFGKEKDGISQLITEDFSGVEDTMRGLGYL